MILAIDTAGTFASVALGSAGRVLAHQEGSSDRSHSEELDAMIRSALCEAGVSISDIQGIVLGKGPGSFTGLRIGFAMAQGVALHRKIPVYPLSSALGADADRVLAPAGKGLLFESERRSDGSVATTMKSCAECSVTEPTAHGRVVTLAQLQEFPTVPLARNLAEGLLKAYFSRSEFYPAVSSLSALEPEYVRPIAAKTIAQRTAP